MGVFECLDCLTLSCRLSANLTSKMTMPNSITYIDWWLGRCICKNGHKDDMCFKGIGLYAQILSIILGSIINLFLGGRINGHLMTHCQWISIAQNYSKLALQLCGIDHVFIMYIQKIQLCKSKQYKVGTSQVNK